METRPHTVPIAVDLLSDGDTPYNHLHWQENGLEDYSVFLALVFCDLTMFGYGQKKWRYGSSTLLLQW